MAIAWSQAATRKRAHYWLGEGLGAGRKRIRSWIAGGIREDRA